MAIHHLQISVQTITQLTVMHFPGRSQRGPMNGNWLSTAALSGAMDIIAINDLRTRYTEAVRAAERYRDAADRIPPLRDFYHALSFTYERMAREANLMLDKADGLSEPIERAA